MDFIILNTNSLLLKGISSEMMNSIFELHSKHEIMAILGHKTEEDFLIEELKFMHGYSAYNRRFLLFLMVNKSNNEIVGRCGLHNWNPAHDKAEIGYAIELDNYKGKGLMTETVAAVLSYGFNELKLNRIEALVGEDNLPSLRLLAINNFIKEGMARQHYKIGDKYVNSILFSKLREEFDAEKN